MWGVSNLYREECHMAQVKGLGKGAKSGKVPLPPIRGKMPTPPAGDKGVSLTGQWARMSGHVCHKCQNKSVVMNLHTGEVKCSYVKCGVQIKPPKKGGLIPVPKKTLEGSKPYPPVKGNGKVPLPPVKGKAPKAQEAEPEKEDIVDVEIINIAEVNVKDEKLMKRLQKALIGGEDSDIYILAEEYQKSKPKDKELAAIFDAVPQDVIQEVRDVCFYYSEIVEVK